MPTLNDIIHDLAEVRRELDEFKANVEDQPVRRAQHPAGPIRFVVVRSVDADAEPERIYVQKLRGEAEGGGVVWTAAGNAFLAHIYPLTHPDEYRRFIWLDDPAMGMVALPYVTVEGVRKRIVWPFDLWDPYKSEPVDVAVSDCFPPPANTFVTE